MRSPGRPAFCRSLFTRLASSTAKFKKPARNALQLALVCALMSQTFFVVGVSSAIAQKRPVPSAPESKMATPVQDINQESGSAQAQSDRISKASILPDDEQEAMTPDEIPGPNLVTAATYPFTATSAIALEDMSTGTTQL